MRKEWVRGLSRFIPILFALTMVGGLFWTLGVPPLLAYRQIVEGGLGDLMKLGNTLLLFCPLLICTLGLLYTFRAGQWNIGMEGQITMGAIAATWVVRQGENLPRMVLLGLMITASMIAGALWSALSGWLKTRGHVSEIFSGMGLNYISQAITIFLICGPWRQPTGATLSGTAFFPEKALLPRLSSSRFSWLALLMAGASFVITFIVLRWSTWGVKLKAVGTSQQSVISLRLKPPRIIVEAFLVSGMMAGMAGFVQTSVYQKLVVSIAGNIGFLAIFAVLLAESKIARLVPISLFFALAMKGGSRLQQLYQFDSSVSSLIQILIVFFVVFSNGLSDKKGG